MAIVLVRRRQRSVALLPVLFAVVGAIVMWSYTRFARTSGGLIERLFPDLMSRSGVTRQDEWALAWRTIVDNPVLGGLTAQRAGGRAQYWSTDVVHNAFLFAWMKLGLAGLLSLMTVAASCVVYAVRGVKARGPEEHIALGVVAIVPFGLVLCVFESALISFRTMSILALAGALAVRVATALDQPRGWGTEPGT